MDTDIKQQLELQQKKIEAIYASVEKTRKYIFWTMIATLVFFVLPLIAAALIVPALISSYVSTLSGLGL